MRVRDVHALLSIWLSRCLFGCLADKKMGQRYCVFFVLKRGLQVFIYSLYVCLFVGTPLGCVFCCVAVFSSGGDMTGLQSAALCLACEVGVHDGGMGMRL